MRYKGMIKMEATKMAQNCIKNIRITLGLTQKEFADKIGIDGCSVSQYEAGNRTPSYPTMRRIVELATQNGMDIKYTDIRKD
jgi:transcriptional regulator with XRE-family HTH domain